MFYILIVPGESPVYPYTLTDLKRANPGVSFPRDMSNFDATPWYCFPVLSTEPPVQEDMVAVRIMPELIEGIWYERWALEQAPVEPVPEAVSPRQARLALLGAGLLSTVENILTTIPSPQGDAARIDWEYATEFRRDSALITEIAPLIGINDEQIDDLFRVAQGL